MYAVVEGIDGSGKDTQADILVSRLRDLELHPIKVSEPCENNPQGQLLRKLLASGEHPESHAALFLADRLTLLTSRISEWLKQDLEVISSRSFISTLVYQQEQWPLDWLLQIHRVMPLWPDVIIWVDVDPPKGLERVGKRALRKEHYERIDIQVRNQQRFRDLLEGKDKDALLALFPKPPTIIIVDGEAPRVVVHDRIWEGLTKAGFYTP